MIAIAASTGGPRALQRVLAELGLDAPPVLIVQHMSGAFTRAFARRLDDLCALHVCEAQADDRLEPGTARVAPGGRHLELRGTRAGGYHVELHDGPAEHGHRPSADVLFRSVARAAGENAFGLLLTGMGSDGAAGLLELRRAGGATLVESQESCIVFGMPRAALALGAADTSVSLEDIPAHIQRWIDASQAAPPTTPVQGRGSHPRG